MKRTLSIGLLLAIVGLTAPGLAQECEVGGLILEDTTWDPNDCPDGFVVTSSIVVGCGKTLTILPDTLVRVQHGLGLSVGGKVWGPGTLIARGTEESPIVFTSDDPYQDPNDLAQAGDWVRIDFTDYASDAEFDADTGEYLSGCVLEYVTVEYAGSDAGPAVRATSSSPYLAHCVVHDNQNEGMGLSGTLAGPLKIEYCQVHDNTGGGIRVTASGAALARIEYCEIARCAVNGTGGGIYLTGGSGHVLAGNNVQDCTASSSGGGIYVDARVTLDQNTVSDNTAGASGGGICLDANSDGSMVSANQVTGNSITGSNDYGAGIYLGSSTGCTLTGNTVTGNSTSGYRTHGGGISLSSSGGSILTGNTVTSNWTSGYEGHGGGIYLTSSSSELSSNIVSDNTVTDNDAHGAGIFLNSSGSSTLASNIITGNQATGSNSNGGGLYLASSGSCTLSGNTVSANTCADRGGGMYFSASGNWTLSGNTITENTCGAEGGAVYFTDSGCNPGGDCTMINSIVACNHTTAGSTAGIYVTGSPRLSFAGDPDCATYNIFGCCPETYVICNGNPYDDSGVNDIDARYNVWCTDDMQEIQECIYDYFDDASKAFVYFYPFCERLVGDIDDDWDVDQSDLGRLLADWGCVGSGPEDCPGDIDGDFDTDQGDLGILLAHWGEACPECP